MAHAPRETLKQAALIAFVALGVILASLNWAGNLDEQGQSRPGFYRATTAATMSAPAITPTPKGAATATPTTPTPGPSPTPFPTIED
jgi:hypothetical protein